MFPLPAGRGPVSGPPRVRVGPAAGGRQRAAAMDLFGDLPEPGAAAGEAATRSGPRGPSGLPGRGPWARLRGCGPAAARPWAAWLRALPGRRYRELEGRGDGLKSLEKMPGLVGSVVLFFLGLDPLQFIPCFCVFCMHCSSPRFSPYCSLASHCAAELRGLLAKNKPQKPVLKTKVHLSPRQVVILLV